MEYTTNDLAKILDVSTNTIRRFGAKGYLDASRDEKNGYRRFGHADIERMMYVEKYRKLGFGHDNISGILQEDIGKIRQRFQDKMDELDGQIAHLKALRHLLKDDVTLMDRVEEFGADMIERECSCLHYVLYQKHGKLCVGGSQGKALHRFMSTCPEFEYIYLLDREDVENDICVWSEGVASNEIFTAKYGVDVDPPVELYAARPCVLRFIRLPLDITDETYMSRIQLWRILFGDVRQYMKERGYRLAGDVLGMKICYSREENREWQYVLMHFPVCSAAGEEAAE